MNPQGTVAAGGMTITGTYCVLRVDGVLEWVCWAVLIALSLYVGNKLLDIFSSPRKDKTKQGKSQEEIS